MARRLAHLFAESDPTVNFTLNPQRAELIKEALAERHDIKERVYLMVHHASEMLHAGFTLGAIREL